MKKIAFILSAVVITLGIFFHANAQSVSNPNYWKTNVASSTITPLNTSLQVPCANIVGGCGSGGGGSSTLIYASSGISATASGTNGYIIGNTGVTSFNGATGTVSYAYSRGQTKTVCASNALDTTNCDYKATGTGDQVVIQNAINAASSTGNGGHIVLSDGTFNTTGTIQINSSDIWLSGQGQNATYIDKAGTSTPAIQFGNSQAGGAYVTSDMLSEMNISCPAATSTVGCVYADGFGNGSVMENLTTNYGGYGVQLEDADRVLMENVINNNPYIAGEYAEEGTGNSYGNVTWEDDTVALAFPNTTGWLFDHDADESSPVPFDRITLLNDLLHANLNGSAVQASTTGLLMNVGARGMTIQNSLFESNKNQVALNSEDHIDFSSDSFLQDSASPSANCFIFNNNGGGNAQITFTGANKFSNCTDLLNSISGSYPTISDTGLSKNDGNITNMVTGSYSYMVGTDVNFWPTGTLTNGLSTGAYSNVYTQNEEIEGGNITPSSSYTSNLGSSGDIWNNIYTNNISATGAANLPNTTITGTVSVSATSTFLGNVSTTIAANSFVATNAQGILVATGTPSGGSGGVATTTPYSTGYLQEASSSGAITNSPVYSGSATTISIGTTTVNGIVNVVNASNTAALRISATTGATSSAVTLNVLGNASTSPTAPVNIFQILSDGHINATGTQPTMGTCGSSPSVIGSDAAGTITVGSGVVTSCTINWQVPYETTNYRCIATDNSAAISSAVTAQTTSTATFGLSATLGGGNIFYMCSETL